MKRIISPSVLSADFGHLADDIAMLDRSEAEWVHIDVMDGVFVPNISFGFPLMPPIRKGTKKVLDTHLMIARCSLPIDAHLMIVNPEKYIERFAKAGADIVTIHLEATDDLHGAIATIKKAGVKAGVSIKPKTPVSAIVPYLNELDLVLIMSVEPGFGGQAFIPASLEKIAQLRALADELGTETIIEVDGGISSHNAHEVFGAGADVLVAGNAVFGAEDPQAEIVKMLNA